MSMQVRDRNKLEGESGTCAYCDESIQCVFPFPRPSRREKEREGKRETKDPTSASLVPDSLTRWVES
jgi:hypothetical protein